MADLIDELRAQQTEDPNYISELTQRAAQEILRLRAQVARSHSDRQYIIGFNDGFDTAVENANAAKPMVNLKALGGGKTDG